jgi:hypothetical protein|tara:strand:+ start:627 stop:1901 length:1275 start_codon:yes stop_codon:yes gene_type:complete
MKINIFVSAMKAFSSWLHGEGGRHFKTYTYPRIKQATRRIVNLGIYERFEHLYKIVDDTFYNGAIETEVISPLAVESFEQLAEMQESADSVEGGHPPVPSFSKIRANLFIWKGPEQGRTYRCGTFAMNNMLRSQMLKKGLKPEMEVTAIDPLYIATKHGKGKTGTVMDRAFKHLENFGFPIPSWSPRTTDHNTELQALESSLTVSNALLFTTIRTTGVIKKAYTYAQAVEFDRTLPDNYEMQVSIAFSASLQYFGHLVPFLKKVNGKYSLTRTGGHAVAGVRGSFSNWEDGEAGMAIIESAYRSSEDGLRFIKAKLFDYGLITVRFVEFSVLGQAVAPAPTPTPAPTNVLATETITYNDDSQAVKALQQYLISEGIAIPDGPTTYFGAQTRVALKTWQDKHFGPQFTGKVWGSISQEKYKQLKS